MRALIHPTFGTPEEVLRVEDRPLPEPGDGQVRLRIVLSPIHNHDLWTVRGTYGFKPELPAASGTEALGVVDALGAGVEHLEVGQRVATGGTFGAWAEYIVTNAAGLIPIPDGLPDETAAQLVSMPFSAITLLDFLDVQAGGWIVQNAANGAVGRMLAQLGSARGVNVLGLVRRTAGVDELRAQGIEGSSRPISPIGRSRSRRSPEVRRSPPASIPSVVHPPARFSRCSRKAARWSRSERWTPPPWRSPPPT